MSTCPTCHGTGEVPEAEFRPGLAEALHAARTGSGQGSRKVSTCTMCLVIEYAMPGEAREALVAAAAGRISGRALHRSLRLLGLNVSREGIDNHRNEAHQP